MPLNVDVTAFEEKAQQVMDSFRKGPGELKAAVGMLNPDELAGVYHFLHAEGGLGKLEGSYLDQIRAGTLQLRNPEFMRAAIALRVLMDQKPGAHQARIGMVDSPHEPTDPSKYTGGSPILDKYMTMGKQSQGLKENKTNKIVTISQVKQIIREEIQHVKKKPNNDLGHIYLFESKNRKPKRTSFKLMIERFDKGLITADTVMERWTKSLEYEAARLDEEVAEYIPGTSAYKMRKATGGAGLFEKVSDFILKVSIQAHELAKRDLGAAVNAAQKIFGSAEKFKQEHPGVYKAAVVVGITVAVFGLMAALDADSAQAAIKAPGLADGGISGETLSQGAIDALEGMIMNKKGVDPEFAEKALHLVKKAAAHKGEVDFSSLKTEYGQFASEQLDILDGIVAKMRAGDENATAFLKRMREAGENLQLSDLPDSSIEYTTGAPTDAAAQAKIKAAQAAGQALNK